MKVKVLLATGTVLNWMVAKAQGEDGNVLFDEATDTLRYYPGQFSDEEAFDPSTDWSQGGPIIEREQLWLTGPFREREDWKCGSGLKSDLDYAASEFTGPTPLIAAMRCYAASKLGDEVDVPEELCE